MSHEDQKPVYEPLANFMSELSLTRVPDNPPSKDLLSPEQLRLCGLDASHAGILHAETMQTMFSFMQLWNYRGGSPILKKSDEHKDEQQDSEEQARNSSIVVVLHDQFYPEEIFMPSSIEDACQTLLPRKLVATSPKTHNPYCSSLSRVLWQMHCYSGQANHYGELTLTAPTPHPPRLQIFEFVWRKFFGFTFTPDAFDDKFPDTSHKLFTESQDAGDVYVEWPDVWPDGASQMVGLP